MEIFCFFLGLSLFFTQTPILLFCLFAILFLRPQINLVFFCIFGLSWGFIHACIIQENGMPRPQTKIVAVEGIIDSLPTIKAYKTQFQLQATKVDSHQVSAKILLTCYQDCAKLHVGEKWSFKVKLSKPRNLQNPGGFDYVNMLATKHIYWQGIVYANSMQLLDGVAKGYFILRFREYCARKLSQIGFENNILGVIEALTLGITTHITQSMWDVLRRTGVTHLMVISGAHIGLVYGLIYSFTRAICCRLSFVFLIIPAQKIASIVGFIAALIYEILARFGVPAQRSVIMCLFAALKFVNYSHWTTWQAWRYALFAVVLLEPHSVKLSGFYLSFAAVAILIAANQRFMLTNVLKSFVLQIMCLLGLMPLTLYFFSYGSINGFFANILAIPWVSFVVVPLALFILFVGSWWMIPGLKWVMTQVIVVLLKYLSVIDSWSFINISFSFNNVIFPLSLLLIFSLVVVCPIKQFLPIIIILCLSIVEKDVHVKPGVMRVYVLDVGQGLAVVVKTAKHVLLYDTGMKFYHGSDMAKLAIIPYLKTIGVDKIDSIVISHSDLDHRGGLVSLEKAFKVDSLIVDDPRFYHRGDSCHNYKDWQWDGVLFHFFAIKKDFSSKNNKSCVLQIADLHGNILLTGDIERQAEHYLVQKYGNKLQSTVMLIPHHGSKTSSSLEFLKSVKAKYAIASYGLDNRYHFPHREAMQRYKFLHIPVVSTARSGMINV